MTQKIHMMHEYIIYAVGEHINNKENKQIRIFKIQ